jgi:WD40 repeat protein
LDGGRIITASKDETSRIWDAATGQELAVLRHDDFVGLAAFSPDGTRVLTGSGGPGRLETARVWDASSGKELVTIRGPYGTFVSGFSPDGRRLVGHSKDGTARIWDATSGEQVLVLRGNEIGVATERYSPDGSRVVTA